MKTVKRTYKDSLFRDIFHDEVRLAELSAGLLGEVVEFSDIQLTTLDWTFFTGIRNDVGFLVKDCHIVLLEHQSTLNKNMPLRLLMYVAELYRQYVDDDAVYRLARIPLPAPRFYVLYNGEEEMPDRWTQYLSDAFGGRVGDLELTVEVVNINETQGGAIFAKSRALKAYSAFVAKVRRLVKDGASLEAAVRQGIRYCLENNYLEEYFRKKQTEEVFDMLNFVWDQERALKVRAEEAAEEAAAKAAAAALE
ncbi:MAG: Rpn family recombination-promoting nuclease/putative transposase, partial [Selenomonas sp.]